MGTYGIRLALGKKTEPWRLAAAALLGGGMGAGANILNRKYFPEKFEKKAVINATSPETLRIVAEKLNILKAIKNGTIKWNPNPKAIKTLDKKFLDLQLKDIFITYKEK